MTVRPLITASSLGLGLVLAAGHATAQVPLDRVERAVEGVTPRVVDWRRDLHANPELGFAEVRTAGVVAEHLRSLGLEVRTGVGRTGVVGILRQSDGEPSGFWLITALIGGGAAITAFVLRRFDWI